MSSLERDRLIDKATELYQKISTYSRDREVSIRLTKAVASTIRNIASRLILDGKIYKNEDYFLELLKNQIMTTFVSERIFDKAQNRVALLPLADRIAQTIVDEFRNVAHGEKEPTILFAEFLIMLNEVKQRFDKA